MEDSHSTCCPLMLRLWLLGLRLLKGRLDDDLKGMDDPLLLDNGKFGFRSSALGEVVVLSVRMRGSSSLSLDGSQLDLVAESFSDGLRCSC